MLYVGYLIIMNDQNTKKIDFENLRSFLAAKSISGL